ncbi:MAG: histidine phosphatase family protein [Methanobacteriota archaeon]
MTTIFLARHAEAAIGPGEADGQLFSVHDGPLSDRGRLQAAALREALAKERIDAVVASPAKRTLETARIVAEPHSLPVLEDPGLSELPFVRRYGGGGTGYEAGPSPRVS